MVFVFSLSSQEVNGNMELRLDASWFEFTFEALIFDITRITSNLYAPSRASTTIELVLARRSQ